MLLTKHKTDEGSRWAIDHSFLPLGLNLSILLEMPRGKMFQVLQSLSNGESAIGVEEAPLEPGRPGPGDILAIVPKRRKHEHRSRTV